MSAAIQPVEFPHVAATHQYGFKVWFGMDYPAWQRLLTHNRFDVSPRYLHLLPLITLSSLRNSFLQQLEKAIFGRRIERTELVAQPLFVIGHWRSGTTLLHELLNTDDQLTSPSTYQCFFPGHFLVSTRYSVHLLRFALPAQRFSDSVPLGWHQPMEDEFALCNLGVPSPYLVSAFPNRPQSSASFSLAGLSAPDLARWKEALTGFLTRITLQDPRRIVLKSPTHTYRLRVLLDMFPEAQFIHIVRDPFEVFRSTLHSTKVAYLLHALQVPNFRGLEESVFQNFLLLHQQLDAARSLLTPANFHEVRYEDLVNHPIEEMRRLYARLGLGDFDATQPRLEELLRARAGYRSSSESLSKVWQARVAERWGNIIERYGYNR